jgi:hypothetical protein
MNILLLLAETTEATLFEEPGTGTTIMNMVLFAAVPVAVIVGFVLLMKSLRKK